MTKWLNYLEESIVAIVLAVMSIIAFANVLTRNVFDLSLAFTEEVTVNLFVFLTFVHLGFSLLYEISPKQLKKAFLTMFMMLSVSFFLVVAYYGYETAQYQMQINNKTPALGWPQWIYTMALPIGSGLCIIRVIQVFLAQLKEDTEREQEVEQ